MVVKRSQGSSELVLIFALMLFSMLTITITNSMQFLKSEELLSKSYLLHISAERVRNNLIAIIDNAGNWSRTQTCQESDSYTDNDHVFDCLLPGNTCAHGTPGRNFVLNNYVKQFVVNPYDPTQGFTMDGLPCNTFNAATGNDDCPFRYDDLRWYADCHTEDNLAACISPKINVRASLLFKPASQKFKNIPFNSLRYTLDYTRAPTVASTVYKSVLSFDDSSSLTTVPVGSKQMSIEAWGAGGGGAGGGTYILAPAGSDPKKLIILAGGGGGGGGYVKRVIDVIATTTYKITVGKGGAAGTDIANGIKGENTVVEVFGAADGADYVLTSFGGEGGFYCSTWPCNDLNGKGLGGSGGTSTATKNGAADDNAVKLNGKNGQKYNAIHEQRYHSETLDIKWIVEYFGGPGGNSGGGFGAGGTSNQNSDATTYLLPTAPGGGGAGTKMINDPDPSKVIKPQVGANGKVNVWFGF
ncbi:MAG: glycine-rich domain-containing protein [Bdellovibrio sp.]